ncbi:MAG: C4-type zinc ribbon domain-containing protein [Verrucomicrobia bacterium]|nr:C4-type zinc ribbon domain-containing protein [Verrucomicrobiota bacterium]
MLNVVENLLVLQDRDRALTQLQAELAAVAPQRAGAASRAHAAQTTLEAARQKTLQLEAERKRLELEVQSRKQLIEKYSLQQFQTKRNEEYRALTHEITTCQTAIVKLEDEELEIMEQLEQAQKAWLAAKEAAAHVQQEADRVVADLNAREQNLRQQLASLQQGRAELAASVEPGLLARYERLRKTKGDRVVCGVEHGACGGCHVSLPAQVIIGCRSGQELTQCPNCGRILFYTRDMDMVRAE